MQLDKHGVMAIDHKSVLAAMHTKTAVCKMQSDGWFKLQYYYKRRDCTARFMLGGLWAASVFAPHLEKDFGDFTQCPRQKRSSDNLLL